ncbi:helix-turn-helix domain-containing protein [uncultured Sphingomonas sp.]|uniref:AraC family transcriptional regulator n=1 Tax=uncultured Sphingomonas sp. TaxID=158754 RepID=UPI0035C982BF
MALAERQLPGGGVARYERPSDRLRDLITGYHFYRAPRGQARSDWFLPGTANIRISWYNKPIAVTIGDRHFDPLPPAAVFGPTSKAIHATTRGGFMVGIGVSALGWARLFKQPASGVADQIVPLDTLWPVEDVITLCGLLQGHDIDRPVAPLLDAFLQPRLLEPQRDDRLIAELASLVIDERVTQVSDIVAAMNVSESRVRRLSYRYFGFSPRLLLSRTRFLRSIIPLTRPAPVPVAQAIAETYFDQSHFAREARRVLGMTPVTFAELEKPFLAASLELRPKVLGADTQALQPVGKSRRDRAR